MYIVHDAAGWGLKRDVLKGANQFCALTSR